MPGRECIPRVAFLPSGEVRGTTKRRTEDDASHGLSTRLPVEPESLARLCQRHRIVRLSLFGSILRDDFHPESDVEVLVEFEPGHVPGLGFVALSDELSALFGGPVDLHTPNNLSRYFRKQFAREAQALYAA